MTRETSAQAFRQIQADGSLSRMRWKVYEHLFHHGPLTRSELDSRLKGPKEVNPSYHKRLSELERQGVVKTVGRRACSITGRECELWDVTANLPVAFVREQSKEQLFKEAGKAFAKAHRGADHVERKLKAKALLGAALQAF